MNIKNKSNINKSVVRIFAEIISKNPFIPFDDLPPKRSQGTGFFIDKKGHILTCAHVVDSSVNILIDIPNISTQKIKCELIYYIPEFDIALLKTINYKNKFYVELGNSDDLVISDQVFAVGFPKSINSNGSNNIKYTLGIISGHQEGLIQTDTPINSGNSGGPLFKGEKVIGINSKKMIGKNVSNIGYSIPINYFQNSKKEKSVIINRPLLNCITNNTNEMMCKILSKNNSGIFISKIYDKSIFKTIKGIKDNILLTKFDNYEIDHFGYLDKRWLGEKINLKNILNFYKNHQKVKIEYFYNKKKYIKTITLKPEREFIDFMHSNHEKIDFIIIGGAVLMNLYIDHLEKVKLIKNENDLYEEKLLVSYILPNSQLNILNNIDAGTFIEEVNDKKVKNLDEFRKLIKKPYKLNGSKVIKLKNNNNNIILLNFDNVKKENKLLSKLYKFNTKNLI